MASRNPVLRIWRDHQRLPRPLRLQWLAPLALSLAVLGGGVFTLPPGPLCDEGMVLFMEGGCDFGDSNVFFYSKLGGLLALNIAFVVGWRRGVGGPLGFVPHFLLALGLALTHLSGGRCDTYYGHPNGSLGQMILELAAFAFLGIALLGRWQKGRVEGLALALAGWNLAHVALFYLWLAPFPHWAWAHTATLVLSLAALAAVLLRAASGGVGAAESLGRARRLK